MKLGTVTESKQFKSEVSGINLIRGIDIDKLILEHLKEMNLAKPTSKSKREKRTNNFSVSQVSYDCYRMIYFSMVEPRQADEDKIGTFTIGDIIDEILKGAFKKAGAVADIGCGKEYIDGLIKIGGTPDIEFNDLIIEVKSVSPFAWKYIVGGKIKEQVIVGKPKIQHVRQLNSYMDMRGVKEGVLLYVNKDNFKTKIYPIRHDSTLMIGTVGRCVTVFNCIKENRVPEKVKGDECAWCNYLDLCKRY